MPTNNHPISPAKRLPDGGERHTVIPTPRSGGVFAGWGVRF